MKTPYSAIANALLAAIITSCMTTTVVAQTPTAEELLSEYHNSLDRMLSGYSFTARSKMFELGGALKSEVCGQVLKGDFIRKGDHWRYLIYNCGNKWHAGKLRPSAGIAEQTFTQQGNFFEVIRQYEITQVIDDLNAFSFESLPLDIFVVKATLEDDSLIGRNGFAYNELTRPLFGYLPFDGNRQFVDILREEGPSVADSQSLIQGHACWTLTSKGFYGERLISLDPAAGYLPRRVLISKNGADIYDYTGNKQLLRDTPPKDEKHRKPSGKLESYTCELRNVEMHKTKGRYWISGFELVETEKYHTGEEFQSRQVVDFELVSFEPTDHDLQLATTIPDGTKVMIRNAPAVDCEWRGGRIVKQADLAVVDNLANVEFASNRSRQHSWLLWTNVAVVASLVVLFVVRRRIGASS